MAQIINNPNGGINSGVKPTDWSKIDWSKYAIDDFGMGLPIKTTQTKVLCKDGTFGFDISSPNAKYDNSKTCINNGGRAEKQQVVNAPVKTQSTDSKIKKITGAYNKNLIIAVVLVAGYFAYKKFKK